MKQESKQAAEGDGDRQHWNALWYLAAALTHVLLLDLVIETVIVNQSVRLWLISSTVLYGLAAIIGSYSGRLDARRLTLAGSLFLAGALLICASPFGGNAIRLLGFGTDKIVLVLLALTTLVVGTLVALGSTRHLSIRILSALITVYGVYSFADALVSNDKDIQTLFAGEAFWSYLPFWMQGPWVATIAILGAGSCILLVSLLRRVRGQNLFNGLTALAVSAGVFAFSVQFALTAAETKAGAQTTSGSSIALHRTDGGAPVFPASSFEALDLIRDALPRDRFDPEAIVQLVGQDPLKLTQWVAEHTILVPYAGALRDPAGVIMDRSGNSLDRSLLLAELFRIAGLRPKVVLGKLTDDGLASLKLGRKRPDLPPISVDKKLNRAIEIAGLDPEVVRNRWDKSIDAEGARSREVQRAVEEQSSFLMERSGMHSPDSTAAGYPPASRRHWWVTTNGAQFDPSFPGAKTIPASAEAVFQPDDLPANLYHRIRIRAVVEVQQEGDSHEIELVGTDIVPARTGTTTIRFTNFPMDWPGSGEIASADEPSRAFEEALLDQYEWLPQLSINGNPLISRYFNLSGDIFDAADLHASTTRLGKAISRATTTVSRASDLFGSLPGGEESDSTPSGDTSPPLAHGSLVTAEWLEYTIESPDRPTQTIRRTVFDLVGKDRRSENLPRSEDVTTLERLRRATALFARNDILVQSGDVSKEYLMDVMIGDISKLREPIRRIAEDKEAGSVARPRPLDAYLWSLFRSKYSVSEFVLDQINVAAFREDFVAQGSALLRRQTFDIVKNDVLPLDPEPGTANQRLRQGVVDTAVENFVLPACAVSDRLSKCKARANASTLLNESRTGWELIRSKGDLLSNADIPASTAALLASRLDSGNVLLIPGSNVWRQDRELSSWWEIDPTTGATLGYSELGGSAAEYAVLAGNILGTAGCFIKYSSGVTSGKDTVTAVVCIGAGTIGGAIGIRNAFAEEKAKEFQIVEAVTAIIVGIISFGSDVMDAKGW
jgi:hypothetical protein